MFSNFTWWEFFGFYCIFLLLYYPLIISIYFRPQVSRLVRRSNPTVPPAVAQASSEPMKDTANTSPESISDEETNQIIESLKREITSGIKSAKETRASREDVLSLLKSILSKYPELKKTGQQVQINEFIVQQAVAAQYPIQIAQTYALWPMASLPA